jgi:hypothetical protein
LPFEEEITFLIPSQAGFPDLNALEISADEVEEVIGGRVPSFLQNFRDALARQRMVPSNVSATAVSPLFSSFAFLVLRSHASPHFLPIRFPR